MPMLAFEESFSWSVTVPSLVPLAEMVAVWPVTTLAVVLATMYSIVVVAVPPMVETVIVLFPPERAGAENTRLVPSLLRIDAPALPTVTVAPSTLMPSLRFSPVSVTVPPMLGI